MPFYIAFCLCIWAYHSHFYTRCCSCVLTWQMLAGGKTTTHALGLLEPRGVLFTGIQQEVYNGMIIGECSRDGEMEVRKSIAGVLHLGI